jgi:hypothetical protein
MRTVDKSVNSPQSGIVALLEAAEPKPGKRGLYMKRKVA